MFKDDFRTFRNKVQQYSDKFDTMTEEATKNAIIMPFLVLLGYDVFDPEEIIPEYTCDVAGKKGEKSTMLSYTTASRLCLLKPSAQG